MNRPLSEPAAVPLDFLTWLERDADWLVESLTSLGVTSGYGVSGTVLHASTLEALAAANRIRGFAYLAAPGLRPPYFDLRLSRSDGETVRCVTLFPTSVAPEIGPMDFARESFAAGAADPAILDLCEVPAGGGSEFRSLSRSVFRDRFFEGSGDLRVEFAALNTDPSFIAHAFDLGFFVEQGDLTGRLLLAPE